MIRLPGPGSNLSSRGEEPNAAAGPGVGLRAHQDRIHLARVGRQLPNRVDAINGIPSLDTAIAKGPSNKKFAAPTSKIHELVGVRGPCRVGAGVLRSVQPPARGRRIRKVPYHQLPETG